MILTAVAFVFSFLTVLRAMPDGNILTGMLIASSDSNCCILGADSGVSVFSDVMLGSAVVHRRFGPNLGGRRQNLIGDFTLCCVEGVSNETVKYGREFCGTWARE
jgi:hypothetical protein